MAQHRLPFDVTLIKHVFVLNCSRDVTTMCSYACVCQAIPLLSEIVLSMIRESDNCVGYGIVYVSVSDLFMKLTPLIVVNCVVR